MSHIAQPWCFGRSMGRYSPDLLVEMMTIAHRWAQAGRPTRRSHHRSLDAH